jgi:dihydrofolate reductase
MSDFTIISAMCPETRAIGYKNAIPWKCEEDMEFFRTTTRHVPSDQYINAVIMGRNTFESLNARPLKGRLNVVCSRVATSVVVDEPFLLAKSLDDALIKIAGYHKKIHKIFVIGGEQLYREAIRHPSCCEILLNYIHVTHCDYDTVFPPVDDDIYIVESSVKIDNVTFNRYIRRTHNEA